MTHEVFISYSKQDAGVAQKVLKGLESQGIACWMAPRDIEPGQTWSTGIERAIKSSRVMVVIYSSNIFKSKYVQREIQLAVDREVIIIPFRIEKVDPAEGFELYLSSTQWLDAYTPPLEAHIRELVRIVGQFTRPVQLPSRILPSKRRLPIRLWLTIGLLAVLTVAFFQIARYLSRGINFPDFPFINRPTETQTIDPATLTVEITPTAVVSTTTPAPTPTATEPVHTPSPTNTATPTRPTETPQPTESTVPSLTATPAPEWITEFADPILADIANRSPDVEDDFEQSSKQWNLDPWCGERRLKLENGRLFISDCHASHRKVSFDDFVLEVSAQFIQDADDGQLGFQFRGIEKNHCTFKFSLDGNVYAGCGEFLNGEIVMFGSEHFGDIGYVGYDRVVKLRLIAKGDRFAFYVDEKPLGYFESRYLNTGGFEIGGITTTGGATFTGAFDDFKAWNITDLEIP